LLEPAGWGWTDKTIVILVARRRLGWGGVKGRRPWASESDEGVIAGFRRRPGAIKSGIVATVPLGKIVLPAAKGWVADDSEVDPVVTLVAPLAICNEMVGDVSPRLPAIAAVGARNNLNFLVSGGWT
jgi:hypothetical protein